MFGVGAALLVLLFAVSLPSSSAQANGGAEVASKSFSVAEDETPPTEALQRGDAAWQAGELDRAIYYYVLSMQKSFANAETLAKIGVIEQSRGNMRLAEKAFEMAHVADPHEPRVAERLAWLYLQQARVDSAADIYAQVLAQNPFAQMPGNRTVAYFLDAKPSADALQTVTHQTSEQLRLGVREIYAYYPDGIGDSKLKIPAAKQGTARNMNTIAKLAEMAASLHS